MAMNYDPNYEVQRQKEEFIRQMMAAQQNNALGALGASALGMTNQGLQYNPAKEAKAVAPTPPQPNPVLLLTGDDE